MPKVEKVRLPFNYRSGQRLINASEAALGEIRGYKARGKDRLGTVNFHESPDGLKQQAEKICTEIIPASLRRRDERRIGDIAVLYLDRNDGDVIEEAARAVGFKFIRMDRGDLMLRHP